MHDPELLGRPEPAAKTTARDEKAMAELLLSLGFQPDFYGYHYTPAALKVISVDKDALHKGITKEIYPAVAEKLGTRPSRVERAIRYAIEKAFENPTAGWLKLAAFFPVSEPPTNKRFLFTVNEVLRLKMAS